VTFAVKEIGDMVVKTDKVKSPDKNKRNKLAVVLFVVISFLFVFAWRYFDLPHTTAVEFVVRSITITILSILATWLILKMLK
jgi:hypothetical protein